jgi:nitrous oxidase accessory protein
MRTFLANLLGSLWLLVLIALSSTPAYAQQPTPFDLAAAIANADPGAVIEIPAGIYAGPLTLDRPVTLRGESGAIIDGGGDGSVIVVNAPDVTLEGLTVRNSGDYLDREDGAIIGLAPRLTVINNRIENALFGIYLKNAPNSQIQGNTVLAKDLPIARRGDGIRVWYSDATIVADNDVFGSRDVVIWFSPNGIVRNNRVEHGRYGLHFMFSNDQHVEDNQIHDNSVGIYVMYATNLDVLHNKITGSTGPSGYGLGLKDSDNVRVEGNELTGNRVGVYIDNSPREANSIGTFTHNFIGYNQIGITMLPLVKRNRFTENTFQDNEEQVAVAGSGDVSQNAWSYEQIGNYWSDYAGFDLDDDQVGDLPYVAQSFYESLLALYPELRIFQLSPATAALDVAARAFPIFAPHPKMTDEHPLMVPPVKAAPVPTGNLTGPLAVALGLVLAGLLIAGIGANPWSNYR